MASSVPPASTSLVLYNPALPYFTLRTHLEMAANRAYEHLLELARFQTAHLSSSSSQQLATRQPKPISNFLGVEIGVEISFISLGNGRRIALINCQVVRSTDVPLKRITGQLE